MSTPFRKEVTFDKGRLVWGAPGKTKDKDKAGKPLTTKDGKPRIKCDFGVAIPKNGTVVFWQTKWGAELYSVARSAFPHLFQADGTLLPGRKFSFKVVDGDSTAPNENGRVPCQQEGYPGCWVVSFGSSFVPRCVRFENGAWVDINPNEIKTGHEVQVAGSIDTNGDAQKPGVYVNHGLVAHAGILPEILSTGIDPTTAGLTAAFSGSLPMPTTGLPPAPGAAAPATPAVPAAAPVPAAAAPAVPGVPAMPTAAPTAVVPNAGFLNGGAPAVPAAAPAAPAAPPVPAVPAGPVMTAKAGATPYAAFKAQGWTDDQLRANGYIV